jgi:SAM-dependent methyltransferase
MPETINCSFCGSDKNNSEEIGIFTDTAFENPGEFPLVRCQNCGLIYYQKRPTGEEIGLYYPDEYIPYRKPIQDERFAILRWARWRNIRRRCRIIEKYSPKSPGTILDVGCSTGIFLNAMQIAGWDPLGIEINENAVHFARKRFGLNVHEGQLDNIELTAASFEAITFWDVIEHTFDPLATLIKAHSLLKKEGIVVMTLPHWESLDRRIFGSDWIGYDAPRHLYIFPRLVLTELLSEAGFEVQRMWCDFGGFFTFVSSLRLWLNTHVKSVGLRKGILKFLSFPGVRFIFQPIFSIIDWIDLGGTLVVIAQKI